MEHLAPPVPLVHQLSKSATMTETARDWTNLLRKHGMQPFDPNAAYLLVRHLARGEGVVKLEPTQLDLLDRSFANGHLFEEHPMNPIPSDLEEAQGIVFVNWPMYHAYAERLRSVIRLAAPQAFVIRRSTSGGGLNLGDWYCKGHLYIFLLFRRWGIVPRELDLYLVPDLVKPRKLAKAFGSFRGNLFHILDAVYSGNELVLLLKWAENTFSGNSFWVVTPLVQTEGENAAKDIGVPVVVVQDEKAVQKSLQSKKPTVFASEILDDLFVLPFKIADATSLGEIRDEIYRYNPGFLPPYRRGSMCGESDLEKHEEVDDATRTATAIERTPGYRKLADAMLSTPFYLEHTFRRFSSPTPRSRSPRARKTRLSPTRDIPTRVEDRLRTKR